MSFAKCLEENIKLMDDRFFMKWSDRETETNYSNNDIAVTVTTTIMETNLEIKNKYRKKAKR